MSESEVPKKRRVAQKYVAMNVNYLCKSQNASAPCVSLQIIMGPATLRLTLISSLRFVSLFQK